MLRAVPPSFKIQNVKKAGGIKACATLSNIFYKNLTHYFIRTFAFIIFAGNIKKILWRK